MRYARQLALMKQQQVFVQQFLADVEDKLDILAGIMNYANNHDKDRMEKENKQSEVKR